MLSSGSVVRRGEGNGVVMLTGAKTLFGRTTELVQQARPKYHIDAVMTKVVRWLFLIVGALLAMVVVISIARDTPLLEMVPLMLILLMSAIPLSLPVMFTVSMAVGSKELAKRGVLVTRLSAAEDAATMDVLCVDKTGTVTMNQLAVTGVIPFEHATEADVLFAGALASEEANQDPIDLAFLAAAKERHVFDGRPAVTPISFAPFDATNRRTEALVEQGGQRLRVMKGAVETIAQACALAPPAIRALEARVSESAAKGYRTLAVARGQEVRLRGDAAASAAQKRGARRWSDWSRSTIRRGRTPPRSSPRFAVSVWRSRCSPATRWRSPARSRSGVGLSNIRRMMADLKAADAAAGNAASDLLSGADGIAEVYPEDKYVVVKQLQAAGHVTGMTGDGVNDAPALRQAEVGIAVSTATDVAKGAASVVLTESGLTNIVALVEQGRTIYQRILTYIINKISRTILKTAFVAIAFVATGKFVMSAFAMLLLVFTTDFAKISLATDNVRPSRKLGDVGISGRSSPSPWVTGCLDGRRGTPRVGDRLVALRPWQTSDPAFYTFSFLTLLYFAAFSIVSARERRWFWATMPSRAVLAAVSAEILIGTVLTRVGLPGLAALPWPQTLAIFAGAIVACLVVNEVVKVAMMRRIHRS